jgi:peptidoglycan/xylan/chitin deacetylase (PgdA/CDA1 family)
LTDKRKHCSYKYIFGSKGGFTTPSPLLAYAENSSYRHDTIYQPLSEHTSMNPLPPMSRSYSLYTIKKKKSPPPCANFSPIPSALRHARGSIVLLFVAALLSPAVLPSSAMAQGANLISNPGFEQGSTNPTGWIRGSWGTNTTSFTYPVTGVGGSRAARVDMTARTSGDAKWTFTRVPVGGNTEYEFSDSYQSDVATYITVEFELSDGTLTYADIAQPAAAASFSAVSARFVTPGSAVAARIFHLINTPGFLTIDNTSLVQVTTPPPSEGNLIGNPSVEAPGIGGNPSGWKGGKWGSNTAVFSYPVSGFEGSRAVRVDMTARTSGDAKWYFTAIPVTAGAWYTFSDAYRSNTTSYVTVEFTHANGALSYQDIGVLTPVSSWTSFSQTFQIPPDVTRLTVYHLIKSIGRLDTDAFRMEKVTAPGSSVYFDHGFVSLTFDDGYVSAYQNALPVLDLAEFPSTFFVLTGRVGDDFPGYMSTTQILDTRDRGHEIGGHTRTHADLTRLSTTEADNEIRGSREDLTDMGIPNTFSFAYPFGAYNDTVRALVESAGYSASRTTNNGANTKTEDLYELNRLRTDVNTTVAGVISAIDDAIAQREWLIIVFHEINYSGNLYSMTPARFQQIVSYLEQENIDVQTVKQGVLLMQQ